MDIITKTITKYIDIFSNEHKLIIEKRNEWNSFTKVVINTCTKFIDYSKNKSWVNFVFHHGSHDSISFQNGNLFSEHTEYINDGSILFGFGQYTVGIGYNKIIKKNGNNYDEILKTEVEKGAKLLFSQLPGGEIAIIYYYASSDIIELKDKYFVYKIYKRPSSISENTVINLITILFKVQLYSSILSKPNIIILIQHWYWRHKRNYKLYFSNIPKAIPYIGKLLSLNNEELKK